MMLLVFAIVMMPAQAATVAVEITGEVEYNQVNFGAFADVNSGDPVTILFQVDSDLFMNSASFPTRGYDIDVMSFSMTLGSVTVGLQDPYPAGQIPYFVLRNNDPAVDGFFFANNNVDWPFPDPPLDELGIFGQFGSHYEVGYVEETLSSLDILDAVGSYDFTGLTNFYFVVSDGPFDAIGLIFGQMTISLPATEVAVDVKPGSCPNPLNVSSRGVLPAAILGTSELDVMTIDPASIRLAGVAPIRSDYEDVGTPFEPFTGKESCMDDCNEMGWDGWMDLTVKFDRQELVSALGDVDDRQCVVVSLTGNFNEEFGGGPIAGEDVVVILSRGGPPAPSADRFMPNATEDDVRSGQFSGK
jgi:hypothetical protein